ncbi:uncharacterized protein LOC128641237 [Bombina bombina]|uniref:uncharacterized protein LOC128641237 n=1 Tax=Bombina bombina TaxID=8345 RepID=UPI00235A93CE|nr:uncharacterized protein LOC128641237 [Bombina bombina]
MKTQRRIQEMIKLHTTVFLVTLLCQMSSGQKDLQITGITCPNSAQLQIFWNSTSSQVSYFMLDLRVVNNSAIPAVSIFSTGSSRNRTVQGLRAGTFYNVTLKSYSANSALLGTTWAQSQTVPATPQIISSSGISSSEITVTWAAQVGANYYFLLITLGSESINQTHSTLNCTVVGLQPSTVYSLTLYAVNSAGSSAASKSMTALTLTPPPVNITLIPVSSYSVELTWSSVKNALMYGIYIYEQGPPNMLVVIRKTTSTNIILTNLLPCTKYIFAMVSYNWFYTAGEENRVLHVTGTLDAPRDLTVLYSSNVASAVVSWHSSVGASFYVASAKSEHAHEVRCNTSSSSCEIQGLLCEQKYSVSVTAETESCSNNMSGNITLATAPCSPENVTVVRDCEINTVSLYWNPVKGALKYTASALALDGNKVECSNQDTNCFFLNLMCGMEYVMSVSAFDGTTNGTSSPGIKVQTAPCDPSILMANSSCQDSSLLVSWAQSEGALYYMATALGSSGTTYNCTSLNTSCKIMGLQCGESLSVAVVAYDNSCPSTMSNSKEVVTGPCAPRHITALTDCVDHSSLIQWEYSEGAISYTVHANAKDLPEYTCKSFDLGCSFTDLPCGQIFSVFVTASNDQCDSAPSPLTEIRTVPCVPQNVRSEVICDPNVLLVTWAQGAENVTFVASAQESDSVYYNCTSQENSCEISNIHCGQIYSVSVRADNGRCTSLSNETAPVYSAPCKPTQVTARNMYTNGTAEIFWSKSQGLGVEMYVATLQSPEGSLLMCQSESEHCIIQGTKCGQSYLVNVTALGTDCQSPASTVFVDPVPCSPGSLDIHISPGLVVVTWVETPGAVNYTAEIIGAGGDTHICQTSNTTCSVTELLCGHQYNVSLTAIGLQSNSNTSDTVAFHTAPCTPQNVTVQLDYITNIATVFWASSQGQEIYTAVAVGTNGDTFMCSATDTSCDITGLHCGYFYSVSVQATNENRKSEQSLPIEIQTAPCSPLNLDVNVSSGLVIVSWEEALGAVNYSAQIMGIGGETHTCQTSNTTCFVVDLLCSHQYNVSIRAIGNWSQSNTSDTTQFQSAPCTPENVTVRMNSLANIATVFWHSSEGPENYTAIVMAMDGEEFICHSSDASCDITGLSCGQIYSVSVQAANGNSNSKPSIPIQLQTAPCTPVLQQPQLSCEINTAFLAWNPSRGAVSYASNATDTKGRTLSCSTENTSCIVSELQCGQTYNFTVIAANSQGYSPASAVATIRTAPCQPQNVVAQMDCGSSMTNLSWEEAPGAEGYITRLWSTRGEYLVCNSSDLICEVRGLRCGQNYNVSVTAYDNHCESKSSSPMPVYTVPCVPTDVQFNINCESNMVTLSWASAPGAENYTSVLTGPHGEKHYCQAEDTSCTFDQLSCGLEYDAVVGAVGRTCNSDLSTPIKAYAAPCQPTNLSAQLECGADHALLSWGAALGGGTYTATLSSPSGQSKSCSTNETSCDVFGIQCGQTYTLSVETIGTMCSSSRAVSPDVIQTAPCVPENLTIVHTCKDSSAVLTWSQVHGAENYTALVTAADSQTLTCHTSNNSCHFTALQCGQMYNITVTASNTKCYGESSNTTQFITAPCAPANVLVQTDCMTGSVALSWDEMNGVLVYTSYLTASDGANRTCISAQANCTITSLPCGQEYVATVLAANHECQGPPSRAVTLWTAPCVPASVSTVLECAEDAALISWTESQGAVNYSSSVTGPQGELYTCSSWNTSCRVSHLLCGETYNVSVTAQNTVCSSAATSIIVLQTRPCAPFNLTVSQSCSSNVAHLQWLGSEGAVHYGSSLTSSTGDIYTCNTTGTSCDIGRLQCGETYSVSITAFSSQCATHTPEMLSFQTAPCLPTNVRAHLLCDTGDASVLWDSAQGATVYSAVVTGSDEWNRTCTSANTTCDISDLMCGQTYHVTITASNAWCNSTALTAQVYTAPCAPQNVKAVVLCGLNLTTVSWDLTPGAWNYTAVVTGGEERSCSTSGSACNIQGLECGQTYNVTVRATGEQCSITSPSLEFPGAPCTPNNVTTQIHCSDNAATVSWEPASGGVSYVSDIIGANGLHLSCNSTGTSCNVSDLQCGHIYRVTVTAVNGQCLSEPSIPAQLQAGPCVPQIVDVTPTCSSDHVTLSWGSAAGAERYLGIIREGEGTTLTCNTTEQSCGISAVECGRSYSASVEAFNNQCSSGASFPFTVTTAPCVPTNFHSSLDCDSHKVSVLWDSARGTDKYTVKAYNGQNETSCVTANTSCEFNDLMCDSSYEITIISSSETCNSTRNGSLQVKTIPCAPHVLEAFAACENNSAFVYWDLSSNARSYTVRMEEDSTVFCNTTDTVCEIQGLHCGSNYTATVWADDGTCRRPSSSGMAFRTAPCVPQIVTSAVMCEQDELLVSWNASSGATSYCATALGLQGHLISAITEDLSSVLSTLQCGETYDVTVVAVHEECKSPDSRAVTITAAPCSPLHLTATPDCGGNATSASWVSSAGAKSYEAVFKGPEGDKASCNTTASWCAVSGLNCGQVYNVTVTAFDGLCESAVTDVTQVTTAPCIPTSAAAWVECATDRINVTWAPSRGAVSYTVSATGRDNHTLTCNTTTNGCAITGVLCGDSYTISLVALGKDCTSSVVSVGSAETAPCVPGPVVVQTECLTDRALVSWEENNIRQPYYTVVAHNASESELSCTTFNSSCSIWGLECGQQYNVTVSASNRHCHSAQSIVHKISTAPCKPQMLRTSVDCASNDAHLSWAKSTGAGYYVVTLYGNDTTQMCNTTNTSCVFPALQCGQTYNASVVAVDEQCTSVLSSTGTFQSAPCQPINLHSQLDCATHGAELFWDPSKGATDGYSIEIWIANVTVTSYITTNTSFMSEAFPCGQTYGFTMVALGGTCNSTRSGIHYQKTVPCTPEYIMSASDCPTGAAEIGWSLSRGAYEYHVVASVDGQVMASCNSTSGNCSLADLECGLSYKTEVKALDYVCSSSYSTPGYIDTAPCVPQNPAVRMECTNNSAVFTWERSRGALYYMAAVKHEGNLMYTCQTNDTVCEVSNLTCGHVYSFSVSANSLRCESSYTEPIMAGVVPCPPDQVQASIYHRTKKPQEVQVSWNGSWCGADYMVTVQGASANDPESLFFLNSYWTSYTDFYIPVPCSSSYNATVTARNLAGESKASHPIGGYTAPCTPQVNPPVLSEGTIFVSWVMTTNTDEYRVVESGGNVTVCRTTELACSFPLTNSTLYVIAVNPSGESEPTVVTGYI